MPIRRRSAGTCARRMRQQVAARDRHAAGGRDLLADEQPDEGALAGAGRARRGRRSRRGAMSTVTSASATLPLGYVTPTSTMLMTGASTSAVRARRRRRDVIGSSPMVAGHGPSRPPRPGRVLACATCERPSRDPGAGAPGRRFSLAPGLVVGKQSRGRYRSRRRTAAAWPRSRAIPFLISLAALVQWLPPLLFALFAGATSDRLDRRLIVVSVDTMRGRGACRGGGLDPDGHGLDSAWSSWRSSSSRRLRCSPTTRPTPCSRRSSIATSWCSATRGSRPDS